MSDLTAVKCASVAWQKGEESVSIGSTIIKETILKALATGEGALIGRHGSTELTWILVQEQYPDQIDRVRAKAAERYSGIFPSDDPAISREFLDEYKGATATADVFAACWYQALSRNEFEYLNRVCPSAMKVPLRALEPYYSPEAVRWTKALEGQSVCVVSSFAESMKGQRLKREEIWDDKAASILPEGVSWHFVRSYFCPLIAKGKCEWPEGILSWKGAVDYLEREVIATGSRVVLLGCGGLAMPLAGRLKKAGKIVIVMGGSIQILFGIMGRRWDTHDVISGFYTPGWVSPREDEVPGGAMMIEGGCYW